MNEQLYIWMSVGAIAWGLLDCFFGYRVFKVTLAVVGGLLGLLLGQVASTALGLGAGAEVIVMIVAGLLGASVAFLLYKGAVFVAGFGFGATLGVLLLTHYNDMVALMTGVVLGIVGGFLAVKLQRVLIILSTALLGSFRTILAIAYFTGKVDWIYYYQQPQQMPALIDNNAWMLPSVLGLAVVGAIAQFEMDRSFGKKKSSSQDD
ncbi:MAG TPA: DUF4203 domain-containing protein [Lacunisphaera sp.]|jgi:hypothetical protein